MNNTTFICASNPEYIDSPGRGEVLEKSLTKSNGTGVDIHFIDSKGVMQGKLIAVVYTLRTH